MLIFFQRLNVWKFAGKKPEKLQTSMGFELVIHRVFWRSCLLNFEVESEVEKWIIIRVYEL